MASGFQEALQSDKIGSINSAVKDLFVNRLSGYGSAASGNPVDIIVVGGGGAALAAAAESARLGQRVIVLEKNPVLGGSTRLAVGLMMAAGTRIQRRAGVQDTPQQYEAELSELTKAQGIASDGDLRRLLVDNAADTVNFLESIGVDFIGPLEQPPFKVRRFHQALPDGRAYIRRLERHCRSLGVEIRLGARVQRLLLNDARVTGVEIASSDGALEVIAARAGVILATGDFSANRELRARFVGKDPQSVEAYNLTATGDGHLMALEIGAALAPHPDLGPQIGTIAFSRAIDKSAIFGLPPYRILTLMMKFAMRTLPDAWLRPFVLRAALADLPIDPALYAEGAILVNRDGERFADERSLTCDDVARQPRGEAFIVFDNRIATLFSAWPHFVCAAQGVVYAYIDDFRKARQDLYFRANSVELLAKQLGASPSRLAQSLLSIRAAGTALTSPPYFALGPLSAKIRHVPVGVTVNVRLQVLKNTGEAIPGLFAAGDVGQGGFVGPGHGQSLAWALTSGRLAGRYAADKLGAHDSPTPK